MHTNNIIKAIFGFLLFLCLVGAAPQQVKTGTVTDAQTGEALPYATIRVLGTQLGTITDANGKFRLTWNGISEETRIQLSYIGYQQVELRAREFYQMERINLEPNPVELKAVTVTDEVETIKLGNTTKSGKSTGWGDFESLKGRSKGLLIPKPDERVMVHFLNFRISHNEWDSVAFRVNLFKMQDGKPGKSILKKNIIRNVGVKNKWVSIDLREEKIFIEDDLVVSLEWVDAWGDVGEYSNRLSVTLSKQPGFLYESDVWQEMGTLTESPMTPAINLEVF